MERTSLSGMYLVLLLADLQQGSRHKSVRTRAKRMPLSLEKSSSLINQHDELGAEQFFKAEICTFRTVATDLVMMMMSSSQASVVESI